MNEITITIESILDELALNPINYDATFSRRIQELAGKAAQAGIVIVTGESDDLVVFYGAIDGEVGSAEETRVAIDANGIIPDYESIQSEYTEDEMRAYMQRKTGHRLITARWHDEGNPCWTLETDIPHKTFDIHEDGEVFSRAIMFNLSDL